jgi:hypothetical protein
MEAIAYLLLYLIYGRLPWERTEAQRAESKKAHGSKGARRRAMHAHIFKVKKALFEGPQGASVWADAPREFTQFIHYARALDFYETPRYDKLRAMFSALYDRCQFKRDGVFDWTTKLMEKA